MSGLSALFPLFEVIAQLPSEPIPISPGAPQLVNDGWLVDNHWALKAKKESVSRVFHPLKKHSRSPFEVFAEDEPSYVWVIKDQKENGDTVFRMYYQANRQVRDDIEPGRKYRTDVAYAESPDGLNWIKPNLNLFPGKDHANPNNIVIGYPDRPHLESSAPVILEGIPVKAMRGYRYLLMYRAKGKGSGDVAGIHLVPSLDGIHFDMSKDQRIVHLHSDCPNTISYDPVAKNYVLYCRAKQMYRAFKGDMIDTGASRRIATMRSPELWTDWMEHDTPRTLLIPDEIDGATHHHFFYGMPTVQRHGLFWGALEVFRLNDYIHSELVTSRDGNHWQRIPGRPKMIEYGKDGTWDDTMIFVSPSWVEIDDEWWFYYAGWDGPHGTSDRNGSIGLATCLRERLISRRGPNGGGVVCTRLLVWPGGDLWLNIASLADKDSDISVRISDPSRKVIEGFDHANCELGSRNDTRALVKWGGRSMGELKGEKIRLEVMLKNADWFSFGATAPK